MEGGSKLIAPFDGDTVLGRVTTVARSAGLEPVLVATAEPDADIRETLAGRGVRFVTVDAKEEGRLVSAVAGLEAVRSLEVPGVAILLGDEPGLRPDHVRAVVAAVRKGPALAGRVRYLDRPGHPVVLRFGALEALLELARDVPPESSLWRLVARTDLVRVTVRTDHDAPIDVDTREALALARRRSGGA
jgi:CTP:molybdopterin cytidylyltransferase MocA